LISNFKFNSLITVCKNVNRHKTDIQGPPKKKCIHTLTKENFMLYVGTKFNYTLQVECKLQWSTIQVSCTCTVNGGAQSGCR